MVLLNFRTDGRTDDGRTDDERTTNEKKSDEEVRTKKISDEKNSAKKKLAEKNFGQKFSAEKFIESIDNDDDDLRIKIKKLFFIFTGTLSQVPLPVIVSGLEF